MSISREPRAAPGGPLVGEAWPASRGVAILRPPARPPLAGAHTIGNPRRPANPRPPKRSVAGCAVTVPHRDDRRRSGEGQGS